MLLRHSQPCSRYSGGARSVQLSSEPVQMKSSPMSSLASVRSTELRTKNWWKSTALSSTAPVMPTAAPGSSPTRSASSSDATSARTAWSAGASSSAGSLAHPKARKCAAAAASAMPSHPIGTGVGWGKG